MKIDNFQVTTEELMAVMKQFQNTLFAVHDEAGRLVDLVQRPPKHLILEAIQKLRLEREQAE